MLIYKLSSLNMTYLLPFLHINPIGLDYTNYTAKIKHTIGKIKDTLNLSELIESPNIYTNNDFVKFVDSSNYKFIPMKKYFSSDVQQQFDIYGGIYNLNIDDTIYEIKIYFYKIKNAELITKDIIENCRSIFLYANLVKNNILQMDWHLYRLSLFSKNISNQKFMNLSYDNHPVCKTKLFNHQKNNISQMLKIHHNPKSIKISDSIIMQFHNNLIYDFGQDKFISKSEIPVFEINSGAILDEPGTGKTLQFIIYLLETGLKSLIIVPNNNIKDVWIDEFKKHIIINLDETNITINTIEEINYGLLDTYDIIGVDEFHVLYKSPNTFSKIINSKIKYRWAITGTPFITDTSLFNIIKFITGYEFKNERIANIPSIQNELMELFLKNRKIDMVNDYVFPDINMYDKFVTLDNIHKNLYNAESKLLKGTLNLRKLVCEVELLFEEGEIKTPKELKNYGIRYYRQLYDNELQKLEQLHKELQNINDNKDKFTQYEFINRIDHYNNLINKQESEVINHKNAYEYFINSINHVNSIIEGNSTINEDNCPICMDNFSPPITYFKNCGHYFCKECIDHIFKMSSDIKCPCCRQKIEKKNVIVVDNVSDINLSPKTHEIIKIIKENTDNKYIIFTQFSKIIDKLQNNFNKNSINTMTYNEYVHCQNKDDVQIILLSSEQNAEGINLSMFDNIIIYEPFENSMYCKEIEKQLIGRIHRIGRTKSVDVFRLITLDTIEQEIYHRF